jgi:cell division septation protein DedD
MIRDFSKDDLEPGASSNETELTIGGGLLMGLGGGLLLLCAVCFGAGYIVGHRSSSEQSAAVALAQRESRVPAAAAGSSSKPGAARQQPQASADSVTEEGQMTQLAPAAAQEASGSSQQQVRPALDAAAGSAQTASALKVQPAMNQVQGWMVQIAAVTHAEDADVLVDALRKRGYSVTARRDAADSLIHVQTGPFVNRNDANVMRQKLLNDGYNAIVQ